MLNEFLQLSQFLNLLHSSSRQVFPLLCFVLCFVLSQAFVGGNCGALAADDLSLRPDLSFTQDIDSGFPIIGKDMDDASMDTTKPTFIFFGASGDLNTNRQAKRVVDIYHKTTANTVKFIIVDVDHPANDQAKALIKSYYKGYIPSQLLINKQSKVVWSQTGETDLSSLKAQIEKVL